MRRLFLIILSLFLFGLANAQTWNIGTPVTTDVTATLSNDTLYVRGTGDMSTALQPWRPFYPKYAFIEEGVTSLGNFAQHDSLISITIPESVTSIGNNMFIQCSSLTSITIPESMTSIGNYAFYRCSSLISITLPAKVTNIGEHIFQDCNNLTSITILGNIESIGYCAFFDCSNLTSITIPNSVKEIGFAAFFGCSSLTSITIPRNVTSIASAAFQYCTGLISVTILGSQTTIEGNAFYLCTGLKTFINLNPVPQNIDPGMFLEITLSLDTLIVPCGSRNAYKNAWVWQDFGTIWETCDISNVHSTFSCPGEITINYDLYMEDNTKTTNITVYYSTDNRQTYHLCNTVSGDLANQSSGIGKTIVWDLQADGFNTGFFVFKVEAELKSDPGCVMINGVCWATRNVGAPGTFVDNPEDAGMFYQWNRNVGWSAANPMINSNGDSTWDSSTPTGTKWEEANDPSPAGWRVPTSEEIQSLLDTDKVNSEWTTQNGVTGRKFTDKASGNSIFLPITGSSDGTLYNASMFGHYWSSTPHESLETSAYCLLFHNSVVLQLNPSRNYGFFVRSVAE